jgi:prepilin-type N-terminal cleavage/methylation domain-containing protein
MTLFNRLCRRLAAESGYSLVELLQVMVILSVVLGGITAVFVQASSAELDMNRRFQAQQVARLAVDKMRRELHCASSVTPAGPASSVSVTLPSQCPTNGTGAVRTVVYDTQLVTTNRYRLRRDGVALADYVTAANAFEYSTVSGRLATLRVTLPIKTKPDSAMKEWRLVADIVLRNSPRSP